jgi:hypothetical protein
MIMASKNDITLDTIWNRPTETYRKNLENIDFTVRLGDQDEAPEAPAESYRYLEVSPTAFQFVSMAYQHPDHNVRLTFDTASGELLNAEVIREA